MSETLAFLIDAPMQAWGASSKFQRRETESWPTKSALIGLLAAALGIDKHALDEVERLAPITALTFSVVRWPKESHYLRLSDFHTIGGGYDKKNPAEKPFIPKKAGDGSPFGTVITRRTYLTDARFIALLEGDPALLRQLSAALNDPVWGLWFGRKTCIPSTPLGPVIAPSPREALADLIRLHGGDPETYADLEALTETPGPGTYFQADQPIAFGRHQADVPAPYQARPVRRIPATDL